MKVRRYKKRRQENRSMKNMELMVAVKVLSPITFYSLREKSAQYADSRTF